MILFTDKNIGFVHIPKCGGTSVTDQIKKLNEGWIEIEGIHTPPKRILDLGYDVKGWIFQVRNPYTRFMSEYFHQIRKKETNKNFEFYIKQVDTKGLHLIPQSYFVKTELDKTKELNFIGRYENYIDDVNSIFEKLNINETIPHRNRNPIYDIHPNLKQEKYYSAFYKEKWMEDWVKERYKDDFKIFNYGLELPR